jgi:hypothetical protein
MSSVVTLLTACTAGATPTPAGPAAAEPTAQTIVREALDAMGGESRLRAIHSVRMATVASAPSIEGADRPEPPWQMSHYLLDDWLDYAHGAWRKDVQSTVVDGGDGHLEKFSVIVVDGVAAVRFGDTVRPGGPVHVGDGAQHLINQPDRLALAARDASDLWREGDASIAGQPHHIVAFRQAGRSIRLWIDARTHRLNAAEIVHTLPEDAYWRGRGDIHDRLDFLRWTLEPTGVWLARQHDQLREGRPFASFVVTSLEINAVRPDTFAISDDIRAAYRAKACSLNSGYAPGEQPVESIAPGVWLAAAARNELLIGQPGGSLLIDAPISEIYVGRTFDEMQRRFATPIAAVILSNADLSSMAGIREAAVRGVAIRALDVSAGFVDGLLRAPHTLAPDALARSGRRVTVDPVASRTVLGTGATRVELIPMRGTLNERVLLVWLPGPRLLWVADALGSGPNPNPSRLAEMSDVIARERLDVDIILGARGMPRRWADLQSSPAAR